MIAETLLDWVEKRKENDTEGSQELCPAGGLAEYEDVGQPVYYDLEVVYRGCPTCFFNLHGERKEMQCHKAEQTHDYQQHEPT